MQFLLTEIYKSTVTSDSCGTSSEKGKFRIICERVMIIIISFILIRKRFFQSHIYRNRPFRPLTSAFLPPAKLTTHGTNSAHCRGTLILNQLPNSIKSRKSIVEFKRNLKQLGNIDCGCVICRKYFSFFIFLSLSWMFLFLSVGFY